MNTENTNTIEVFNKKALIDFNNLLGNLNLKREPQERIKVELDFFNYFDLSAKTTSVLDAIQIIAYDDRVDVNSKNSAIYDLAEIVKKMLPHNEMEFLDSLFLEPTENKTDFININKI